MYLHIEIQNERYQTLRKIRQIEITEVYSPQCGNRGLRSNFFDKNFVKVTVLLKKTLKS